MANIGNKKLLILLFFMLLPAFLNAQDKSDNESDTKIEKSETEEKKLDVKETKQPDVHQKMLEKLNITASEDNESLLRRGEIVFFIAFGYTYLYQFMIYDLIITDFRGGAQKGYLADRNLYFALFTSIFLALFVARNDSQKQTYIQTGKNFTYPNAEIKPSYERSNKGYNWYFNFFSWDF